jgi:DNA polymerase III subunit epsilon
MYEDQNGYCRLAIEKNKKHLRPVHTFHYLADGHSLLRKLTREYNLCPKLCFLQTDNAACEGTKEKYCYGACDQEESPEIYNQRVQEAVDSLSAQPSFAIIDAGLSAEEQSCILVCDGKFYGMGYIPADLQLTNPQELKDMITPYKENIFIRNIVNGYAARFPAKVKNFSFSMADHSIH